MSRLKLRSIGFESLVNIQDDTQFYELLKWLDSNYFRAPNVTFSNKDENFASDVEQFLSTIKCPLRLKSHDRRQVTDWLIDRAVDKAYARESCSDVTSGTIAMVQTHLDKEAQLIRSLATLDIHGAQFKKEVEELAQSINVIPHPDHLVTLLSIDKFIEQSIVNAIEPMDTDGKSDKERVEERGKSFALDRFDLGVRSSGNRKVDLAVRALRLIHVHRLRELQTQINELIVRVQKLTANPKADLKLGRVGF